MGEVPRNKRDTKFFKHTIATKPSGTVGDGGGRWLVVEVHQITSNASGTVGKRKQEE